MRVLVTGSTGFVGLHTALALHRAGHKVRLGVRSESKMRRVFQGFDIDLDDFAIGSITDPEAVARALTGVDAVVHCAAMVTLDAANARIVLETNLAGAHNVLGQAFECGLQSIVHVSSMTAIWRPVLPIDEDTPHSAKSTAYMSSKIDCDLYARELIAKGAPLAVTYPTGIVGPDDPGLSETNEVIAGAFKFGALETPGGVQLIDVRDLAQVHVALVENRKAGLYVVGGHHNSWREINDLYDTIVPQKVRRIRVPRWVITFAGRAADLIKHIIPFSFPLNQETAAYVVKPWSTDSGKVMRELGMKFRPTEQTLRDTIRWLVRIDHIDRKWDPGIRDQNAAAAGR